MSPSPSLSPVLSEGEGEGYSRPRHQMEALGTVSFLGSGSQKYCTIRLHFSSTPAMIDRRSGGGGTSLDKDPTWLL